MPLLVSVPLRQHHYSDFVNNISISLGLSRSVHLARFAFPLCFRSVSRSWQSVSRLSPPVVLFVCLGRPVSRHVYRSISLGRSLGLSLGRSLGQPLGLSPVSCGLCFAICALVALRLGQSLGLSLAVFWPLSLSVSHLSDSQA